MEAITDAEIDGAVKFIFEKFDRDNNSSLDRDEIAKLSKFFIIDIDMRKYDLNGNGRISAHELRKLVVSLDQD